MDEKRHRDDDLPGSVSNQNREEAEPGHGAGEERRGASDTEPQRRRDRRSGGEAGEGSQSTGSPDSAG